MMNTIPTAFRDTWQEIQHPVTLLSDLKDETLEVYEKVEDWWQGHPTTKGASLVISLIGIIFRLGGYLALATFVPFKACQLLSHDTTARRVTNIYLLTMVTLLSTLVTQIGRKFNSSRTSRSSGIAILGSDSFGQRSYTESVKKRIGYREYIVITKGQTKKREQTAETETQTEGKYTAVTYFSTLHGEGKPQESGNTQLFCDGRLVDTEESIQLMISCSHQHKQFGPLPYFGPDVCKMIREVVAAPVPQMLLRKL